MGTWGCVGLMVREGLSEVTFELSPEGEGAGFRRSTPGGQVSKCKGSEVGMDQMKWDENPSSAFGK